MMKNSGNVFSVIRNVNAKCCRKLVLNSFRWSLYLMALGFGIEKVAGSVLKCRSKNGKQQQKIVSRFGPAF